jgi:riboflavin kinase
MMNSLKDENKKIDRISGLKVAHIPILIELLSLGAKDSPVKVSTTEISRRIGKSQQLASKHILELENEGYVERFKSDRQYSIKLTEKGLNQLMRLYLALKEVLEAPTSIIEIEGELFSGIGEGSYYVSLEGYRRQFIDKLGFDPYLGTLNLKLTSVKDRKLRRELEHYSGISIDSFKDEHRTYGGAKCFMAVVNDLVEGVVGIFERSHYDDSVLEIISPTNIRKELNLKDGDKVKVKVFLEASSKPRTRL